MFVVVGLCFCELVRMVMLCAVKFQICLAFWLYCCVVKDGE